MSSIARSLEERMENPIIQEYLNISATPTKFAAVLEMDVALGHILRDIMNLGAFALGCYLLCWYCKQLEKSRRAIRVNVDHEANSPGTLPPRLRSVESNSVDHLLETLILSYRNRLASDYNQPMQNIDGTKNRSTFDLPPKYVDALKMPKPQQPSDVGITAITENSAGTGDSGDNAIINGTGEGQDINGNRENDNFVAILLDDDRVPSYEDAIRKK